MATTNLCLRIDSAKKQEAEKLFNNLGMNLTTALNIFINQALRVRGIPFHISEDVPNGETLKAIEEACRIALDPSVKAYDVEEALRELKQ